MQWLSADIVFDGFEFYTDFFILVGDKGEIIRQQRTAPSEEVNILPGLLMPGMVNAHCHLELSHTKGLIDKETGLTDFLQKVNGLNSKETESTTIQDSMRLALSEMRKNGIVAVGDICNTNSSIQLKNESDMLFHSFVECIAIRQQDTKKRFEEYAQILLQFSEAGLSVSFALHSPYTCNEDLYQLVNANSDFISIHNQESEAENLLFEKREGHFDNFYNHFGLNKNEIIKSRTSLNSLENTLRLIGPEKKVILIHNTYTQKREMNMANEKVYWCFCPNANFYIENKLPDIKMFLSKDNNIVIGTDSLASNDSLSILSEVHTIHQHFPEIPLSIILKWSTSNGAKLFDLESTLGSFETGKTPGFVSVPDFDVEKKSLHSSACRRIEL